MIAVYCNVAQSVCCAAFVGFGWVSSVDCELMQIARRRSMIGYSQSLKTRMCRTNACPQNKDKSVGKEIMDEHQFRELIGTERRLKFNRQPGNGGEGGFVYTVLSFICETVDGKVRTHNGYRIGEIRTGPYGQVIPSKKFIEKYPQFRHTKMIRTENGLVFEDVDTPIIAVGEEGDTTLAAGRAIKACSAAKKSSRLATSKVARASAKKKAAAKTTKAAASKTAAAKDGDEATATKAKATAKKTAAKKTAAKTTKAATKTAKSASEAKAADKAAEVAPAKTTKTAAKKTATKKTAAKTTKAATKTAKSATAKTTTAKTAKAATAKATSAKATKATATKATAAKAVKSTTGKKVDVKAHEKFMAMALEEAKKAEALGEVPVGAILVTPEGEVVGRGCNRTIVDHDATAHAEVVALRRAGQFLENYRLNDLTMYVTLEPCCMCVMACVHARIKTIVFGAEDPKTGACASVFDLAADERHNHRLEIVGGIMDKECSEILSSFFKTRRAQQKAAKPATKTVAKKATKTAKATKAAAKPATKKVTAKKATAAKKTTAAKATATKAAAKTTKVAATKATATKATATKAAKAAKPAAKKATATKATAAKKTAAKPAAKKAAAKPAAKKATAIKATAAKAAAPKAATEAKVAPAVKTDDKTKA